MPRFPLKVFYQRRNKNSRRIKRWGHYSTDGGVDADSEHEARARLLSNLIELGYKVIKIERCTCNIFPAHKHNYENCLME